MTSDHCAIMSTPRVTHDWYQTETTVVVEVRLKNCAKDAVKCDITPTALSLSAPMPNNPSSE